MYYEPHELQKRTTIEVRNKYGELERKEDTWVHLVGCRCDDNSTDHFQTDNGGVYVPKYKIVCDRANVKPGDYVRVLRDDGSVKGEGRVFNAPTCNFLDYMTIYV